jgi:hypothetical protein
MSPNQSRSLCSSCSFLFFSFFVFVLFCCFCCFCTKNGFFRRHSLSLNNP